jgi:mRNA interferase MazF
VNRGEVYDVDWPGLGAQPAVIVTRPTAIPHLANVTVVLITTRVRGLPTGVELGADQGLIEGSVANCDNVLTIPKTALARYRGALGPTELRTLDEALRIALALDDY